MLVTTSVDATPVQCMRIAGPTFITLVAAVFVGGVFMLATYKAYWAAGVSGVLGLGTILAWLWTGTAEIPEKETKDVGLGLRLPLYVSGRDSVGWWAMFITMLGVFTAFVSLVFGYFFYWTLHENFPPDPAPGPGLFWPLTGCCRCRRCLGPDDACPSVQQAERCRDLLPEHRRGHRVGDCRWSRAGGGALAYRARPRRGVYAATVWVLVLWSVVQVALGVVMQVYCAARRLAGRMTARYDIDICNVVLYWHFTAATVLITVAVIAGFPLAA